MNIWIPTKDEIEGLLQNVTNLLKSSKTVSAVEEQICDTLSELECHIENRAGIEEGRIQA